MAKNKKQQHVIIVDGESYTYHTINGVYKPNANGSPRNNAILGHIKRAS